MVLLALMQHMSAVGRTPVARALAVRTGFGARLHYGMVIGVLFLCLALSGDRDHTDNRDRQRCHADAAEFSSHHGKPPFLNSLTVRRESRRFAIASKLAGFANEKPS
jgi:hypothetical protein